MNATVTAPVSDRGVSEDSVIPWVNREAIPVLRQLRQAANYASCERQEADSAGDGNYVTVWTSPAMPTDATWQVTAHVVGVSISGAAQRASYMLVRAVESTAGTVAAIAATTTIASAESAGACDARLQVDASGRTVYVDARDDATSPMRWVAVVHIHEVAL